MHSENTPVDESLVEQSRSEDHPTTSADVNSEEMSGAAKFMRMMQGLQKSVDELQALTAGNRLTSLLIAELSCDERFIHLVRRLAQEVVAESVAHHSHADTALLETPDILGYTAEISSDNEPTPLKACLTDADHPVRPNGVEIYLDGVDGWTAITPPLLLEAAVRQALINADAPPYRYYFINAVARSSRPLSDSSVAVAPDDSGETHHEW